MKKFCTSFLLMFALTGALPAVHLAQAHAPVTTQKQSTQALTALTVEIRYRKDQATFIAGDKSMWFVRFERLAGWQQPAGSLPVRAVEVASHVENETTLKINVSVRLGERYHDEVKLVGTYPVRENESVSVEELKQYGIVPVGLRVVRVKPAAAALPYVESRMSALELTGIETREATFPTYIVRLRNVSGKEIAALQVYYYTRNSGRARHRPQLPQNETLIKAGAVFELNAYGGDDGELTPEGYAPDALQKVSIATVVFTDGTFEGEPLPAAQTNAQWRGRKLQLTRTLALVYSALQDKGVNDAAAVGRFRARVAALDEEIEASVVDELATKFSLLSASDKSGVRASARYELHRVKLDLLDALTKFEEARAAAPETINFQRWLVSLKESYEGWLARL